MTLKRASQLIVSLLCMCCLACGQLPRNFAQLPLDQKVTAYRTFFEHGGRRSLEAEELLASHGYEAAEAMAPYITREVRGIPLYFAIRIVRDVQLRGCDLRGSGAEKAIREALEYQDILPYEREAAKSTLSAIVEQSHIAPPPERIAPELCNPALRRQEDL